MRTVVSEQSYYIITACHAACRGEQSYYIITACHAACRGGLGLELGPRCCTGTL